LPDELPPKRQVNHAIKVMLEVAPLTKASYWMSHEELKELKVQFNEWRAPKLLDRFKCKFKVKIMEE
jgi:hypothetical protein